MEFGSFTQETIIDKIKSYKKNVPIKDEQLDNVSVLYKLWLHNYPFVLSLYLTDQQASTINIRKKQKYEFVVRKYDNVVLSMEPYVKMSCCC